MTLLDSVRNIILKNEKTNLNTNIPKIQASDSIVIFGAGSYGEDFAKNFHSLGFKILYFIDNDSKKWGETINDIPVISPQRLLEIYDEKILVLICSTWHSEIKEQLISMGINRSIVIDFVTYYQIHYKLRNYAQSFEEYFYEKLENFNKLHDLWFDNDSKQTFEQLLAYRVTGNPSCLLNSPFSQYYHPVILPKQGDIIIDGGAFIGDTAKPFNDYLSSNCKIYSFEPSKNNFMRLHDTIKENKLTNVIPIQAGLGIESNELYMDTIEGSVNPGYTILDKGAEKVKVTTIDEFVLENGLQSVDLIKLDIEGSELDALKGAYQSIRRFRPRLQICLYHKPEDLIEIPLYLNEQFKDLGYKFYLGHHTDCFLETVLYAACE
ncbi:FkbM family methyltransferase [Lysinibacillus sp. NPDC048646]|uniref:FkbM family methyltransferase n=1 Tax=Lysinibacillus sp. NPDC048646 TaxID=3390574 RepID=UPI003D05306C